MGIWEKEGNFEFISNPIYYDRVVKYTRGNQALTIYSFPDGKYSIEFSNPSDELYNEIIKRERFTLFNTSGSRCIGVAKSYHHHNDEYLLRECLSLINEFEHIEEFINEILTYMGFLSIEEKLAAQISEKTYIGKFEEAIKEAKEYQKKYCFEIIWELAQSNHQHLKELDIDMLIDLYQSVCPQNPHYREANHTLFVLLSEIPNSTPLMKMTALINSGNQNLVDQYFHELCGYQDLTPLVKNVQGSASTLITFSEQINAKNKVIQEQNNLIKELEGKILGEVHYSPTFFNR